MPYYSYPHAMLESQAMSYKALLQKVRVTKAHIKFNCCVNKIYQLYTYNHVCVYDSVLPVSRRRTHLDPLFCPPCSYNFIVVLRTEGRYNFRESQECNGFILTTKIELNCYNVLQLQ